MEFIGRPEFDRISIGDKQYAKGKIIDTTAIMGADKSMIVWYHDRPYILPPAKHTGKIELKRNMKVKRDVDGTVMPSGFKLMSVNVEPNVYHIREAIDITGTVSVISDGKALHKLLIDEPTALAIRGTYVPHEERENNIHIRPHVIYKNDIIDLVVTYKDGLYLVSKHSYDGKVYGKPILLSPIKEGVYAFIQRCSGTAFEDVVSDIQTRGVDGWSGYLSKWGIDTGFLRGQFMSVISLSRAHLHNIVIWMHNKIFTDRSRGHYWDMYSPDAIAALCYEYTLRYGYTKPRKTQFTRDEVYEEGREALGDGADRMYILENPIK